MTKAEELKKLRNERDRINEKIKELESDKIRAGNVVLRKKKNGYIDITWETIDEHGDNHNPVIITGFCNKGLIQQIGMMVGDLMDLKEKLKEYEQ